MRFRLGFALAVLLGCGSGGGSGGSGGGHLTGGTGGTGGSGGTGGTGGTAGAAGAGGAGVACNVDGLVMTCPSGTGCCGGFGAVYTCQMGANCQPCSNLWSCDGPEDCPGQVCCFKNRSCEARGTVCAADCTQPGDQIVCHQATDCPPATPNCCTSATQEYPGSCQAAACP